MEGAEREGCGQQTGYYYELQKISMKCAEKGAPEGLQTAQWEGDGGAGSRSLNQAYWQSKTHGFAVLFPVYLE